MKMETDILITSKGNNEELNQSRKETLNDLHKVLENSDNFCVVYDESSVTHGNASGEHENSSEIPVTLPTNSLMTFPCLFCEKVFKRKSDLNRHVNRHTGQESYKCRLCFQAFLTAGHLRKHRAAVHSGDNQFICSVCYEGFNGRGQLSSHMKAAHSIDQMGTALCEICNVKFDSKQKLREHDMTVHGRDEKNKCVFCGKQFTYPSDLKRHERKHTGFRPYICDLCGRLYPTANQLTKHLQLHLQQSTGEKYYRCGECEKSFTTSGDLKRHIRRVHNANLPFTCQVCKESFISREEYHTHRKEVHRIIVIQDEVKPTHECQYCGKNFRYPSDLKRHVITHSETRDFKCDVCGKSFKTEFYVKRHELNHQKKKKQNKDVNMCELEEVDCPVCNKTFSKPGLKIHMGNHSKCKYPCKKCPNVFETRTEYVAHRRKHHPKLFECSYCQKKFKSKQVMDNHVRIHTKETPFQCDICGKRFKQKAHLRGHMQTHTDIQKVSCKYCSKTYTTKSSLNVHMLKHKENYLKDNDVAPDEILVQNDVDNVKIFNDIHAHGTNSESNSTDTEMNVVDSKSENVEARAESLKTNTDSKEEEDSNETDDDDNDDDDDDDDDDDKI